MFHLLEEFLRLCPGGIGFVPDPFTLVIKGEFEISLAATRVSEGANPYQVLFQKVCLNIRRAFLDASCRNRVLIRLVIFVSIGAVFDIWSFYVIIIINIIIIIIYFADVDECREIPDVCSEGRCLNTLGSFNCYCPKGFKHDIRTGTCIGTSTILSSVNFLLVCEQ